MTDRTLGPPTRSWQSVLATLGQVVSMMHHNIQQLMDRGLTVDDLEVRSADLAHTSELFMVRVLPWYKRWWHHAVTCMCCPMRWICCWRHPWSCCRRRRRQRAGVRIRRARSV